MKSIAVRGKRVPVTVLVVLLVIPGMGAASATTFQGWVEGTAVAKVDNAIEISSVRENGSTAGTALGKVTDDRSKFRVAANVRQGDRYAVDLNLENRASASLSAQLRLAVPGPIEVEVHAHGSNVSIARTSLEHWYFVIDPNTDGTNGTLTITVAVPNTAVPGFYRIDASIRPIEI